MRTPSGPNSRPSASLDRKPQNTPHRRPINRWPVAGADAGQEKRLRAKSRRDQGAGSIRACSPSRRHAGCATKHICDLLPNSPAWSAGGSLEIRIICASQNHAVSVPRSVMSSLCRFAGRIIANCIAPQRKWIGGRDLVSKPYLSPARSGCWPPTSIKQYWASRDSGLIEGLLHSAQSLRLRAAYRERLWYRQTTLCIPLDSPGSTTRSIVALISFPIFSTSPQLKS